MGWRFGLGIGLFGLGLFSPLLIPLVMMLNLSSELKVAISAGLMVGIPEVLWAIAIVLLGKEGFYLIKAKVFNFFKKHALPKKVGRLRHSIGLIMFTLPMLFGWVVMYAPQIIMGFEQDRILYCIICDLIFFASFFVLGGEFWGKFKALFTYESS